MGHTYRHDARAPRTVHHECILSDNVIRKDPDGSGHLVIRKLVTYDKSSSRFAVGNDVSTELQPDGTIKVDDLETWEPDFDAGTKRKPKRRRRVKLA